MTSPAPVLVLACDPGADCGVALVLGRPGARPLLLGAWEVYGSRPELWMRRASAACLEARELVAQHEGAEVVCTVEEPPPVSRRGALAGDHHGQRSWVGIGRRQGMMMAAMIVAGLPEPTLVAQGAWAGGLGLRSGKEGDGSHRIREAGLLVQGAAVRLHEIDEPRRIDVAEAILQAAYVAGQRARR